MSAGPCAGRYAGSDPERARLAAERRARLRQLDAHRHGAEGRAGRGGRDALRRLVGAGGQERPGRHGEGMDELQARADRRRHDLSPGHGEGLASRPRPAARRQSGGLRGRRASRGRPPRAARPARSPDADPYACTVVHADDPERAGRRSGVLHDRHGAQTAAASRGGRQPLRPRRADGAALPHDDRPAHEPLHRRHRGQRLGQEPRARSSTSCSSRRGWRTTSAATRSPRARGS